jgi:glycosyltransferase involved in cell wall biosynthesis
VKTHNDQNPYFSIIISVYNRPKEILRCIDSCLSQSFFDFELIVVDDGSTDDTIDVLSSRLDPRLQVIQHKQNEGMSAARDTGVKHSRGEWIVRLDSDHALLSMALDKFHEYTLLVDEDIGVIGARYGWDNGHVTPAFVPDEVVDYVGRIRWVEAEGGTDYLSCTRRKVFEVVQWPRIKGTSAALFQLNQAKYWKARYINDVLGIQYTDARNSYHRSDRNTKIKVRIRNAHDQTRIYDELLSLHGKDLQRFGPTKYLFYLKMGAFQHFLIGNKKSGINLIVKYLWIKPFSLDGWIIFILGLIGSEPIAWAYVWKI